MARSYDIGPTIGIDGEADFRKAILNTQAVVNTLGLELQSTAKKFDKNDKSVENLTSQNKILNKQIEAQKEVLQELNKGLEYAQKEYGENDRKTQQWKQSVIRAEIKLNDLEGTVQDNNEALIDAATNTEKLSEETKDLGKNTEKAEGKLKGFGGKLKNIAGTVGKAAVKVIAGIGVAAGAAAAGLFKLVESTREYRADLSKLEQGAKTANQNYEEMKGHVSELTALTGELDSSVEAVNNLMATGFDENEIKKAVDALSGAVIKFPDTLKIEGLADGLQETLATGKAIGPFAELIERMGGSIEEFNAQMANATTEAEKQQVALDWLANSGLSQVSEEYKEANKDMLAAAEAQQKFNDAIAGVATVIEPSVASVKAGAADVLTSIIGMATGAEGASGDFQASIDSLVNNAVGQINNMIPAVTMAAQTMIPALVNGILTALPQLIQAGALLLNTLILSIQENLPMLIDAALMLTLMIVDSLLSNLPLLAEAAQQIIISVALGIANALPELIPAIYQTTLTIVNGLLENLPLLIDAALQLIIGLVEGILQALPLILEQAPILIKTLVQGLVDAIPMLIQAAISIIKSLISFLLDGENIAMLVTMAFEIIMAIAGGLIQAIPQLIQAVPQLVKSLVETFIENDWAQTGRDIISGIADGIIDAASNLAQAAKDAAKAAVDGVKDLLDINSPSKVMRDEVGLMMGYGIAEGLTASGTEIESALGEVTRKVQVDADYYGGSGGSINHYSNDNSRSATAKVYVNDGRDAMEWERKMNKLIRRQLAEWSR